MAEIDEVFSDPAMVAMFTCPVCREPYNITTRPPMNVPCGHSICKGCLPGLIGTRLPEVLMCPVCRKRYHGTAHGRERLEISKNWQMLSIIETALDVKKKIDAKAQDTPTADCRSCSTSFSEFQLTTCTCLIKEPDSLERDFLDRCKNKLICSDCIKKHHSDHDHKPFDAVRIAWDCRNKFTDLREKAATIRAKSGATELSLDNLKTELSRCNEKLDKTINRLNGRPRCENLSSLASNLYDKLDKVSLCIDKIRGKVQGMGACVGTYANLFQDYGKQPIDNTSQNRPPPRAPAVAAAANVAFPAGGFALADDALLRIGDDGNFQMQFRLDVENGVVEGIEGMADQVVDEVVQRRLNQMMPVIRALIERGRDALENPDQAGHVEVDIGMRAVDRQVILQRVEEGADEDALHNMDVNNFAPGEVPGHPQVVLGNNRREMADHLAHVERRIQRAYDLVVVNAARVANQVPDQVEEPVNQEAEDMEQDEPEAPAAVEEPVEPVEEAPRRSRRVAAAQERRDALPYRLRSGGRPAGRGRGRAGRARGRRI